MLRFMELQRVGHDWATDLNWRIRTSWRSFSFLMTQQNKCFMTCKASSHTFPDLIFTMVHERWEAGFTILIWEMRTLIHKEVLTCLSVGPLVFWHQHITIRFTKTHWSWSNKPQAMEMRKEHFWTSNSHSTFKRQALPIETRRCSLLSRMMRRVLVSWVLPGAPTVIHLATLQHKCVSFQGLGELLSKHRCVVEDADMQRSKSTRILAPRRLSAVRTGPVSNWTPLMWSRQPGLPYRKAAPWPWGGAHRHRPLPQYGCLWTSFGPCDLVQPCEISTGGSRWGHRTVRKCWPFQARLDKELS